MRPSFGARPTKDGVSFRLWAPGARRVDLHAVALSHEIGLLVRRDDGGDITAGGGGLHGVQLRG